METSKKLRNQCQALLLSQNNYDITFLVNTSFVVFLNNYNMKDLKQSILTQEFVLQNENLSVKSKAAKNYQSSK